MRFKRPLKRFILDFQNKGNAVTLYFLFPYPLTTEKNCVMIIKESN